MDSFTLAAQLAESHYSRWRGDLPAFLAATQSYQAVARGLISGEPGPPEVDWLAAPPRLAGDLYTLLRLDRQRSPAIFTPEALARDLAWSLLAPLPPVEQPPWWSAPRIIDPAAGAGALLLAAAEQIEALAGMARRDIVAALCGVDDDPLAIQLARDTLWLWAADPTLRRDGLNAQIICADSLRDDAALKSLNPPFDLLISNPPWASVFTRARGVDDSDLRARYQSIEGAYDLFVPFVEQSIHLTRPGGRAGFILPNRLLSASYAEGLRRWLSREAQIERIEAHPAHGGFAAGVYPLSLILRRQPPGPDQRVSLLVSGWRGELAQAELDQFPGAAWSLPFMEGWERLRPALRSPLTLGDVAELYAGLTVDEAYRLREHLQDSPLSVPPPDWLRFISSGLIRPYRDIWGQKRARILGRALLRPMLPQMALPARRQAQSQRSRLIVAGLSLSPQAAYDPGLSQPGVSTTVIESSTWPLMALCALLNARLTASLYRGLYGGLALSGGYLRVGRAELARLPVPDLPGDDPRLLKLDALGRQARQRPDSLVLADIERMVYHLYIDPGGEPPP